jgi:hypothetical protein
MASRSPHGRRSKYPGLEFRKSLVRASEPEIRLLRSAGGVHGKNQSCRMARCNI